MKPVVSIRNGTVTTKARNANAKLDSWVEMLGTLASDPHVDLPSVDIPVNVNDETGLLVPWDIVDTASSFARLRIIDAKDVIIRSRMARCTTHSSGVEDGATTVVVAGSPGLCTDDTGEGERSAGS